MALTVDEIKRLAEEKLLRDEKVAGLWDYIQIATGDRQTYDESLRAFKRWRFQPRILSARPMISKWTTVLGEPISMPIGIAPIIGSAVLHADAEATFGRAASRAGTLMILSSVGNLPIETFIEKVPRDGHYWAQTYLFKDRRNTLHIVRNAERAGFKAIVVTVDSPVEHKSGGSINGPTKGYHDILFKTPVANIRFMDGQKRDFSNEGTLTELWADGVACHKESFCFANWDELAWLKSQTKLAIVLKGVVSAESARQAASFGVAGILVSAHGGRQLDGVPAPLDVLPEIVHAVKGTNVEIYMDGGVRTGNDVVKALALGARAVFIGRPSLYGLAYNGEEGVDQVLNILKKELSITMALCGMKSRSVSYKNGTDSELQRPGAAQEKSAHRIGQRLDVETR